MRNKTWNIIIANFTICLICSLVGVIQYETIDDYMIQEMLSGANGEYNENVIYINIFLSKTCKSLYSLCSTINWYALFFIVSVFISCTVLENMFIKKYKNQSFIIWIFATLLLLLPLLYRLQYTSVAAILCLTGIIGIINTNVDKKINIKYMVYGIFIVIGSMIRFQTIYLIIPFLLIYYFFEIIEKRINKNTIIRPIVILVVIIISFIMNILNVVYYKSNPIYEYYLKYNKTRTMLHDIIPNNYDINKEIYDSVDWSFNDYKMFKLFNHGEEEVFSLDNLLKIEKQLENNIAKNLKFNIENIVNSYLIIDALIIFLLFVVAIGKDNKKRNILLLICSLCMHTVFIIMGKNIFRVIYPCYIMSLAIILIDTKFHNIKVVSRVSVIIGEIVVFMSLFDMLLVVSNNNYLLKEYSKEYEELYEYVSENKENIYIYPTYALQTRYITKNIIVNNNYADISNIHPQGSWTMYDVRYEKFKEKYGIDNLYKILIDKENVYLIDSSTYFSNGQVDDVITFLNEHYFKENINVQKIMSFNNIIYIYKLSI